MINNVISDLRSRAREREWIARLLILLNANWFSWADVRRAGDLSWEAHFINIPFTPREKADKPVITIIAKGGPMYMNFYWNLTWFHILTLWNHIVHSRDLFRGGPSRNYWLIIFCSDKCTNVTGIWPRVTCNSYIYDGTPKNILTSIKFLQNELCASQ